MMRLPSNFRYRLFIALARLDVRRPYLVISVAVALSIVCVLWTKARLEFHTGQDDLISANNRQSRDYLRYTSEFPDLDGLIVAIKAESAPARAEHFADVLAARLHADHANVKTIFYRIDPGMMGDRALLYLGVEELKQLHQRVEQSLPMLRQYASRPALDNLFGIVNTQIDRASAAAMLAASEESGADGMRAAGAGAGADANGGVLQTDPSPVYTAGTKPGAAQGMDLSLLDSLLGGMLAREGSNPPSPWDKLAAGKGDQNGILRDGYLASDNGKYLLMYVAPGGGAANGPNPVEAIQASVDAVRAQFPGIIAGMTGGPALAHAEETTTARDMAVASTIAIASNVLLLVIPFRGIIEPFFAIVALLTGVAWSFGFTTVAVGHLNLLSAVFTSVLAGIGINFPIHLMARYDEARRRGHAMPEAIELAVVNTGTGVFASACIMALAFLMPMFTDFKGIAELGEISAVGLFLCLVSALLVFPSLVAIRDRNRPSVSAPRLSLAPRASLLQNLFARPALIVGVSAAVTFGAIFLLRGLTFNQNLLKLQASGVEAVEFENTLLKDSGRSSWFAVSLAPTIEVAEQRAAAFRKLPEVSDAETIASYVPDHQAEKLALLSSLKTALGGVSVQPLPASDDSAPLMKQMAELDAKLIALRPMDPSGEAAKAVGDIEVAMARLKSNPAAFADYQTRIAADLAVKLAKLKRDLDPGEVMPANLPRVLRDRFIGSSGVYLVQVYPRGDIWNDAPLKRFVNAVETVDPDVTGPPVQTYNIATVMRHGYERAAVLALIAVFIFVFADFRSLRDALLATVPLIFGGLWLLEAMGAMGWEFNLANLFAVPVIIGMAVDNGVNMLYRWREERDKSSLILTKAVGKSVTIASLTTIAAFAALIPANHRGISSLGWVMSFGVTLVLIATLVVLPALFELLGRQGAQPGANAAGEPDTDDLRRVAGVG